MKTQKETIIMSEFSEMTKMTEEYLFCDIDDQALVEELNRVEEEIEYRKKYIEKKLEQKRNTALFKMLLSRRKKSKGLRFVSSYSDLLEVISNPINWPPRICSTNTNMRMLLLKESLNHSQRFMLTLFLLSNGVAPNLILSYYDANNSLRDESAIKSVQSLIKSYQNPTESFLLKYSSFDLHKGRWEKLNGTKVK